MEPFATGVVGMDGRERPRHQLVGTMGGSLVVKPLLL